MAIETETFAILSRLGFELGECGIRQRAPLDLIAVRPSSMHG
ncbi:hypothetical protein [Salinicola sp. CR57]|nr:hypothetical protein [Salinicola sp. CR57]